MKFSSIPNDYALRLLEKAETAGCETGKILQALDMDIASLQEHKELSVMKYGQLYQMVMRETNNEWFGMLSDGEVPLGAFRQLCLVAIQSSNLHQAIERIGEFSEICRGMSVRCVIEEQGSMIELKFAPLRHIKGQAFSEKMRAERGDTLTLLFSWHRFFSWLVARELEVQKISVTWSEKESIAPLIYMPFKKVLGGQAFNGITYPRDVLSLPVMQDQTSIKSFLLTAPYHLLTEDHQKISLRDRIRFILHREVSHSMPTAEQVSAQLNMSVTTLRRHLHNENTSYQRLKDAARLEAAKRLLGTFDMSNTEIAARLGFEEPSAFFRSFKKWTGKTPGEYRQQLKALPAC